MRERLETAHALLIGVLAGAALLLAAAAAAGAPDTSPPVLAAEAPLDGQLFNVSGEPPHDTMAQVIASATAIDLDTDPAALNFTWRIAPELAEVAPGQEPVVVWRATGTQTSRLTVELWLPDGTYTITWTATDTAGNSSSASTRFTVDVNPPVVSLEAPAVSGVEEVWVTVDVVDDITGVDPANVTVYYRSDCSGRFEPVTPTLTALGGHVLGEVLLTLCEGTENVVQVVATDRAGHGASTGAVAITYDMRPPAVYSADPGAFETVDGPKVVMSAVITDDVTRVNVTTIEYQLSTNGGITWGNWTHPGLQALSSGYKATVTATLDPGTAVAIRWRAYDIVGNGPGDQRVINFYVNGPPFLISVEPEEGGKALEGQQQTFSARFADPDADFVATTFYSDIDGYLGRLSGHHEVDPSGDSFEYELSLGVHNITVVGEDGHGNRVVYTYMFTVEKRPPPDMAPFAAIGLLGVAMVVATWYAWRRAEELEEEADKGL